MDARALYDDNGNGRISCAKARAHGIASVRSDHPAYPYMTDADGDGVACEQRQSGQVVQAEEWWPIGRTHNPHSP